MSTDLESILSGQASTPVPEANTEPQPETTTEQPQAAREPSSEGEPQTDDRGMVPVAALQAERQKAKRYTEQVAEFQTKLEQQNAQWEQRFNQIFAQLQPKPAQPEPERAPDIWADPDAYLQNGVQRALSPVMGQMQALQRGMAEMMFRDQPGAVEEAEKAFNAAASAGSIDPAIHARINNSPNPWAAAVQWHQQTRALAEIGDDPAAYLARKEAEIREKVMAELQQGQQPAASRAAPVMPNNFATGRNVGARSGPAWSGPPSLDDIFKR